MAWILLPHLERELLERKAQKPLNTSEDIWTAIGLHYYSIAAEAESATICRLRKEGQIPEVLDSELYGITGDDLEHATRNLEEVFSAAGYYRVSDHIERKLRALLDAWDDLP